MITKSNIAILCTLLLAFSLVIFANNRYTGSDPRATLLVSDTILKTRSIKLDHYGADIIGRYGSAIQQHENGHWYYFFPIGTSIASVPFVALADLFGFDVVTSEPMIQIAIASITSVLTLIFLISLARLFLSPINALAVASIFWFGTSLASTCGTALWSHNFATLFALISVYLVVKATRCDQPRLWALIAVSLFLAYLCRPTMAILAPFVLLYFFTYFRSAAFKAGLMLAGLLGLFVAFSLHEFGQFLPNYYNANRLGDGDVQEALVGNLVSPARGLLIYSPFILVVWICYGYSEKEWKLNSSLLLIGLVWPLFHLAAISSYQQWWAGGSYGARLMTDVMPGLFLLTLYTWPTTGKTAFQKVGIMTLALSSVFAILVNSGQGLFNRYTFLWNSEPSIDQYPEYLFDWSYPQFIANESGHNRRIARHFPGLEISFSSSNAEFDGWSPPEVGHRWTSEKKSSITFSLNHPRADFWGHLYIDASTNGDQRIKIFLNGHKIYSGYFSDLHYSNWDRYLRFSPSFLNEEKNSLVFNLPDARPPGNGDVRLLAIDFKGLKLR